MSVPEKNLMQVAQEGMMAASFNLPVLVSPEEAKQVVHENLEGLGEFRFEKITMPSGGGVAFVIVDEAGEEQPLKELRGVILDKWPFKAFYLKSFDEKSVDDIGIPDCFSSDGVTGSGCEEAGIPAGQRCETCPKNQWGSDRRGGRGKDCADKIRVHILMEGDVFPRYLDAPPTSLANFKDYVARLSNKMRPFYGVVTSLKLEKATSGGGIAYSKVAFTKAADLSGQERIAIKDYIKTLLPSMRRITRESIADAVDIPASGAAGDDGEPY